MALATPALPIRYTRIVLIFTYNMDTFQQAYFPLYIPDPKLHTLMVQVKVASNPITSKLLNQLVRGRGATHILLWLILWRAV